jgi:porin
MRRPWWPLSVLLLAALPSIGAAQGTYDDRISGTWGGDRTKLEERGIKLDLWYNGYLQSLFSGTGEKNTPYGNRFDAFALLDTTRLGWWKGGFIRLHAEYFDGSVNPTVAGTLLPTNLGLRLPLGGKGQVTLTNFALIQYFSPTRFVMAGKINTVDLLSSSPFYGGAGIDRFQNVAFAAPINGLTPPVVVGALYSHTEAPNTYSLFVYDPNDQSQKSFPDSLFRDGVNTSLSVKNNFKMAGRTSAVTLTGIYSSKDGVSLRDVLLPPELQIPSKRGSWHASVQLDHNLYESTTTPGQNWGLFAKVGGSDGDPNPFRFFFTGGVGGKSPFVGRERDSWGLGYFLYDFSRELRDAVQPLISIGDEQGVELFYSYSLAPGVYVSADLQFVKPARADKKDAVIGGLRVKFQF